MYFGSSSFVRWKSCPGGNSSVSVSPASSVGVVPASRLAAGGWRSRTASTTERCHASATCSSLSSGAGGTSDGSAGAGTRSGAGTETFGAGASRDDGCRRHCRSPVLEQLHPMRERLAREIRVRPRHLDDRELEREPRVAALAHVLERDREQVDEPQHGRLGKLVRLLAQRLLRLLGDRERLGDLAHVLDKEEVAQVLEQVGHEPAEVLSLLGELLDEDERAGGVAVDDHVADAQERVLLDRADELEHGLRVDRAVGRRSELVERRDGIPEGAARAPRDERERRVLRLDPLAVRDAPKERHELASRGRWKTNVWQRERTVGMTFPRSVVQKTKRRWGGGSSISFRSAFQAASVSWCASSRM